MMYFASPLGLLRICAGEKGVERLDFVAERDAPPETPNALEARVITWLDAYFAGENPALDFPLAPQGTAFQQRAWQALRTIPYGKTISYQEEALRIDKPTAVRAIGHANGQNPLPILIPCHRVVRKNGQLGGYRSGLDKKRFLLQLENA